MSEEKFDIVFKGELVRSFDLATVKKNISQLFKVQGPKLDALFSGKTVVLKKNLDFETANKYRVAIKKAGARVDLLPVKSEEPAPVQPSPTAKPKPVFGERPSALQQNASPEPSKSAPEKETQPAAATESQAYGMTIAPVGADVLAESERKHHEEANIDVSQLSVKEGGDLLESSEKRQYDSLDVDLSAFNLAPAGEDLLKENEKKKQQDANVDISGLSLGEAGERLSEPSPEPPPAPDVSGISLANDR